MVAVRRYILSAALLLSACAGPSVSQAPSATALPSPSATAVPSPSATSMPSATPASSPAASAAGMVHHGGGTVQATIKLFQFEPNPLEVPVGTTVVWTNQDDIEHSVTHGTPPKPGGAFDSGLFTKGQTFSFTFDQPGEYPYFCTRHTSMQGVVRVMP
ncbi:cupredoxin domain-containing protein [Kallotenue papyrolyticum]|uniref:cupredoxin domain-containing protein n=1 Tax=Kallotenue papyrolyticum TaxID=1325125 RepID=UPI0009DEB793|nr:plastocyanin/azurin family copper-binding protein [Kallotenue papyrolyticum]